MKLAEKLTPHQIQGKSAEKTAEDFLRQQGLLFITRNFRCKQGEIDLIMQDDETIVFVEVRYRHSGNYGSAGASITRDKQDKIIKASTLFLLSRGWYDKKTVRFDVISIQGRDAPHWIKQAFSAHRY